MCGWAAGLLAIRRSHADVSQALDAEPWSDLARAIVEEDRNFIRQRAAVAHVLVLTRQLRVTWLRAKTCWGEERRRE